jgi:hypothetical protein
MALNQNAVVESTVVSLDVARQVGEWLSWLEDENSSNNATTTTTGKFELRLDMTSSQRDAEYVVACLRHFLPPLGRLGTNNPRKTVLVLFLDDVPPFTASAEGEASAVVGNFFATTRNRAGGLAFPKHAFFKSKPPTVAVIAHQHVRERT